MVRGLLTVGLMFAVVWATVGMVRADAPKDTQPKETKPVPPTIPEPRPTVPPWRSSETVIREVVANPMGAVTIASAETEALANAVLVIEEKLAELDPPVYYQPSLREVRTEFIRKDSRKLTQEQDLVFVSYEIEVTADQIRNLRTRERLTDSLRGVGALTALFGIAFLFFRIDERTKGYLTRWLVIGALGLAAGAAAALYLT